MPTPALVFTVTTLKDTLENVQRFVTGNLASGVDHLVVVLDAPAATGQDAIRSWLDEHPHVTCVPADEGWWHAARPAGLNPRQRLNANAVRAALRSVDAAAWLFHIDGDEVVQLDREVLARVPATCDAVGLRPLEAVATTDPTAPPTLFKQLLEDDDLNLLVVLGVLARASNGVYFRGHVEGKSGVRPRSDLQLTLHRAVDDTRAPVERFTDPRLAVLHYESFSGAEFVRKWSALVASGPPATLRPAREGTGAALRALLLRELSPEVRERYLMRIFDATCRDDVTTLEDLGLLVRADPAHGTHRPAPLAEATRRQWSSALAEITAAPKARFQVGGRGTGSGGGRRGRG